MRLPQERTAEITFGIDLSHTGLLCRGGCSRSFVPASRSSMDALHASISDRDAHEVGAHGYHHIADPEPQTWAFTKGFSSRGRSMLGKRSAT